MEAIQAVFRSWNNDRAVLYRKLNDIPSSIGTAVNVQSMVFGNMGETSGTSVAFQEARSTGKIRSTVSFWSMHRAKTLLRASARRRSIEKMAERFPEAYKSFAKIAELLEKHYKDMQDMEFTIETINYTCCRQEAAGVPRRRRSRLL